MSRRSIRDRQCRAGRRRRLSPGRTKAGFAPRREQRRLAVTEYRIRRLGNGLRNLADAGPHRPAVVHLEPFAGLYPSDLTCPDLRPHVLIPGLVHDHGSGMRRSSNVRRASWRRPTRVAVIPGPKKNGVAKLPVLQPAADVARVQFDRQASHPRANPLQCVLGRAGTSSMNGPGVHDQMRFTDVHDLTAGPAHIPVKIDIC